MNNKYNYNNVRTLSKPKAKKTSSQRKTNWWTPNFYFTSKWHFFLYWTCTAVQVRVSSWWPEWDHLRCWAVQQWPYNKKKCTDKGPCKVIFCFKSLMRNQRLILRNTTDTWTVLLKGVYFGMYIHTKQDLN